jgi:hypothetical protein
VPAPDYGYKFIDRELNRGRQSQSENLYRQSQSENLYRPANPPRQGPQQMQRRFPLSPEASANMQYFDDADFITSSMLPQVFEALGRFGRDDVINEIRGRRRADARRADRTEPLIDYAERVRPRETELPSPFNPEFLGGGAYQDLIPGLYNRVLMSNEKIKKIKTEEEVNRFRELIKKYPELDEFFRRPVENYGIAASRIDPKSFEKYKQYTDLEQKYSDPTVRKDLYSQAIKSLGDDGYNLPQDLMEAEELYTSGDPKLQQAGREKMMNLGIDIASIEKPAFQERKPIIGGGGYTTPEESDDIKYIRQRSKDVRKVLRDMDPRVELESEFPGINKGEYHINTERTFYSPTDFIDEIDPYDVDGYRVSVGRGSNLNRLEDLEELRDDELVSRNVVRFLKDNPGYVPREVTFKIGTPGEEMSYMSYEDLPENMKRPIMRYVQEASMANRRAGSILQNSPADNADLFKKAREQGLDEKTSSYLRAAAPFESSNVRAPSIRGKAYTLAGYGPVSQRGGQITYIDKEGKAIPIQIQPPEKPLVGRVYVDDQGAFSRPAAPYSSQPRFYSTLVPGVTPDNLSNLAKDIRRTPSSLAPGIADLIPSAEAVRAGYEQGPTAMGKQMAQDFATGLPVSAALTPVLANPAVAPLAPGVGLGLVGSAAVEAANEAVRQETGEGIAPKLRQFLGTKKRTGLADKPYEMPKEQEPTPTLGIAEPRSGLQKFRDEIQFRTDLAGERFNPRRGEFGLSELMFGR